MPRPKRLTAREIVRFLGRQGFEVVSTTGSHAKLVRIGPAGRREILIVPMHRHLTAGTVHAIYRQASRLVPEDARFVPEDALRSGFFAH